MRPKPTGLTKESPILRSGRAGMLLYGGYVGGKCQKPEGIYAESGPVDAYPSGSSTHRHGLTITVNLHQPYPNVYSA